MPRRSTVLRVAEVVSPAWIALVATGCRPGSEPARPAERLVPASACLDLLALAPRPSGPDGVDRRSSVLVRSREDLAVLGPSEEQVARRTAPTLVLSDVARAWTTGADTAFEVDLPPGLAGELVVELGVHGGGRGPRHAGAAMEFEARLVGDGAERVLFTASLDLSRPAPRLWHPRRVPLSTEGLASPRLVLANRIVGAPWGSLRACWGNPAVVGRAPGERPPNVLLISVDTLRADHLSCYGYERATSPRLDALLARGALFERATSPAPWTLPSYGSLFTGRMPGEHRAGVKARRDALWGTAASGHAVPDAEKEELDQAEAMADGFDTLAGVLSGAGYRTAALVNNPFLHPGRGVSRGFGRYAVYGLKASDGVDLALEWIEAQAGAPWFLFLHLLDPHAPYAPPAPFDRTWSARSVEEVDGYPFTLADVRALADPRAYRDVLVDMYDAEIRYTDAEIGRLLDALEASGAAAETVIVVHSDHGEELWDHGGFEHGHALWEELLHVPLGVVYPPLVPAGVRVAGRVRTIDVFPTLLDLLGLDPAAHGFDPPRGGVREAELGRSLVPWITGGRGDEDLVALAEAVLYGPPFGAWQEAKARLEGDRKLIAGGPPETDLLFDLAYDPGETEDLAGAEPAAARAMRARLEEWHRRVLLTAAPGAAVEVDEATREALGELGYTDTGAKAAEEAPR